jgi:hypothetical protein
VFPGGPFRVRQIQGRTSLHFGRVLAVYGLAILGLITPLQAQNFSQDASSQETPSPTSAGPAVLTRGQAPAAMATPQIDFRPFVEVTGVYDTGLAAVSVNDHGQLANAAAAGVEVAGGISGMHSWENTSLGIDYRGAFRDYNRQTYYDGADQILRLGLTHKLARHYTLSLRESGGLFSRDFGVVGLSATVPYDPTSSYIPQTDFFDNRTVYLSTQADLTMQMSTRLSFNFGGDGFLARRHSTALYGVTGTAARGDVQYRVTRRTTLGAAYSYTWFDFTRVFSGTWLNTFVGSYSVRLSRSAEFTAYAGAIRAETRFIQTVPLDPVVAAVLGVSEGNIIEHSISTIPTFNARLSQAARTGVFFLGATRTITPGNGLFLTSKTTSAYGGYTYTGIRRWSFNLTASLDRADSIANAIGQYNDYGGQFQVSRQVSRAVHAIMGFGARHYSSPTFAGYNRPIYDARVGVGFSPGDLPLRVW